MIWPLCQQTAGTNRPSKRQETALVYPVKGRQANVFGGSNLVPPYTDKTELTEQDGFAIVAAAASGGLIDVHDRRPVVLSPEDANLWLDQELSPEQAEYLARFAALGPECFEWYKVSAAVNKAAHNDPTLISPIS